MIKSLKPLWITEGFHMIFNFQCEVELITPILQRKKSGLQKCPLNCPKLQL